MPKIIVIALFNILLVSCSYRTEDGNLARPIHLKLNEKFRINLPEDHTTGFTWQLNEGYNASIIDHVNTVWEGNSKGVFFYFKTLKPGSTVLNFTSRKYDSINSIKEIEIVVSEK